MDNPRQYAMDVASHTDAINELKKRAQEKRDELSDSLIESSLLPITESIRHPLIKKISKKGVGYIQEGTKKTLNKLQEETNKHLTKPKPKPKQQKSDTMEMEQFGVDEDKPIEDELKTGRSIKKATSKVGQGDLLDSFKSGSGEAGDVVSDLTTTGEEATEGLSDAFIDSLDLDEDPFNLIATGILALGTVIGGAVEGTKKPKGIQHKIAQPSQQFGVTEE